MIGCCYLAMRRLGRIPEPGGNGLGMSGILAGAGALQSGVLTLVWGRYGNRAASFGSRLASAAASPAAGRPAPAGLARSRAAARVSPSGSRRYREQLSLAGKGKTLTRFLLDKLAAAVALPLILAASLPRRSRGGALAALLALALAAGGFVPARPRASPGAQTAARTALPRAARGALDDGARARRRAVASPGARARRA